jgi:AraC-like DNA-binding protein
VAVLCAVETVNPAMPSTPDAAALCKLAERGQIAGAVPDGPLAFDNAVSAEAALIKGIISPVAAMPASCWCPMSNAFCPVVPRQHRRLAAQLCPAPSHRRGTGRADERRPPMLDVALMVGFRTQACFSAVFKKLTGEPPQRWRQARLVARAGEAAASR